MNKLNKTQRQRNYFDSIERLKQKPSFKRGNRKPHRSGAQLATQELYNKQQTELETVKWESERLKLERELNELFK